MPGLRNALRASLSLTTALIAISCGGEDPLTADELATKGDEICREGRGRFDEIQATPPANAREAADQTETLIESTERELDELRDLEPPSDLEDAFDSYLDSREQALEVLEKGHDAAEAQDATEYGKLQSQIADSAAERHKLARAVGFSECSPAPGREASGS
jgi:hypothetical protein